MGRESFLIPRRDAMSAGPVSWRAATPSLGFSLSSRRDRSRTVPGAGLSS